MLIILTILPDLMAGLSRSMTEAIIETRWEYFGGNIDIAASHWASKDQEKDSLASCHPHEGLVLGQRGAGSLRIQAIDCGLITYDDIIINRQIPQLPHPSCLHSLPGLQPPPTPTHKKEAISQQHYTARGTRKVSVVGGPDWRVQGLTMG